MIGAAALIALQYLVFARTQVGLRLRATAEDRQMAQAVGIPAYLLIAVTFGLGTALAGIAGALLANQFFVSPTGGIPLSIYAYIAVVVGGWGASPAPALGRLIFSGSQVLFSPSGRFPVPPGSHHPTPL